MKNKVKQFVNDHYYCYTIKKHVLGRAKITVAAIRRASWSEDLDEDTIIAIGKGELKSFAAKVEVQFDGEILDSEWLYDCVYPEYEDFLNSGYAMDMVHDAVDASRKTLKARAIAKLTA